MISEQLRRRYELTISPAPGIRPINPLGVVHWYSAQDPSYQARLNQAEPLTWTKHLTDRRATDQRFPWSITALVAEEYARAASQGPMATIPENAVASALAQSPSPVSSSNRHSLSATHGLASIAPRSRPNSLFSLEPSLRRRRSHDDLVSFSPRVESVRSSIAGSGGEPRPRRAHPLSVYSGPPADFSPRSSLSSLAPGGASPVLPGAEAPPAASPTSSRFRFGECARQHIGRKAKKYESDDASARSSLAAAAGGEDPDAGGSSSVSEDLRSDAESRRQQRQQREHRLSPEPYAASNRSASGSRSPQSQELGVSEAADYAQETAKARGFPLEADERPEASRPVLTSIEPSTEPVPKEQKALPPMRIRRSLPTMGARRALEELEERRSAADEQKERAMYEGKAKCVYLIAKLFAMSDQFLTEYLRTRPVRTTACVRFSSAFLLASRSMRPSSRTLPSFWTLLTCTYRTSSLMLSTTIPQPSQATLAGSKAGVRWRTSIGGSTGNKKPCRRSWRPSART
jgi:hypothetical protein